MPSKCIRTDELTELARQGSRLELSLDTASLSRLAEIVVTAGDAQGLNRPLAAEIRFEKGQEGYPRMRIGVTGSLRLPCQRCLHPVEWQVDLDTWLTVLDDEAQSDQLAEPFDSIVMSVDGLLLTTIVEDEILAALPMAPVHETGDICAEVGGLNVKLESIAERKYRPFADLATRVAGSGKGGEH